MKQITMKIKPCFLELIKQGIKKHEYRLNSPENVKDYGIVKFCVNL